MSDQEMRTYYIVANGVVQVSLSVEATSHAEALRKAKATHDRDWSRSPSVAACCLEDHEVTDVE